MPTTEREVNRMTASAFTREDRVAAREVKRVNTRLLFHHQHFSNILSIFVSDRADRHQSQLQKNGDPQQVVKKPKMRIEELILDGKSPMMRRV